MARLVALALLLAIVVPATAAAEAATNDEYDELELDAMAGLRGAMPVVYPESTVDPVAGHAPPRPCPPLVPLPKTLQVLAPMVVPRSVAIKTAANAELSLDAQTLAADLTAMNITVSATAPYTVTLSLNATAFGREAYSLACNSSHATLVGGTDGVWWATRTLLQLFGGQPGSHSAMAATAASAAVSITKDEPEVGFRALLVDSARVPISKAFHLEVIKRLSDLKMNAYHLHLSDDTSYNLPSNIFPNLTGGTQRTGPVLSLRDWQEIVAYAKAYHVELVPEIDMPGHSAWILQRLPALRCPMATSDPRTYSRAYSCPLNFSPAGLNHTVEIVTQLLAEVMTIFNNSKYHHIGGDEVGENMLNSGFCSSLCKANGTYHPADCSTQTRWLDTTNGSSTLSAGRCSECLQMAKAGYHNFVQRIHRFIKSKGRTAIIWEGFDPAPEKLHPNGAVVKMDSDLLVEPFNTDHFDGWARTPPDYYDAGYSIINAASAPLYVCGAGFLTTPEDIALWDPSLFGGPNAPVQPQMWQRLPADHWFHDSGTQAWNGATLAWPITSLHPASAKGGGGPPVPKQIVGAGMSLWSMTEDCARLVLFGGCKGGGAGNCATAGRPGPRVAIVAERSWNPEAKQSDVLDRVNCGY